MQVTHSACVATNIFIHNGAPPALLPSLDQPQWGCHVTV